MYQFKMKTGGIAFALEFLLWGALTAVTFGLFAPVLVWRSIVRIAEGFAIEKVEK
jgi:hypothetical protein